MKKHEGKVKPKKFVPLAEMSVADRLARSHTKVSDVGFSYYQDSSDSWVRRAVPVRHRKPKKKKTVTILSA